MSVLVSVWLITCCDQNYNTPLLNDKISNCVVTLKLCDYVLMFVNRLSTTIWALVGPGRRNIVVGGEAGTGERWGRLETFLRSLLLSLERVYPAVTSCSVARQPTGERWVFMLAWEVIAPTPSLTCVNYYLVRQTDMNTFSMYGGVTVGSFLTKQENIYEIIATTKKWNSCVCGTATRRLFHAHRPEPY